MIPRRYAYIGPRNSGADVGDRAVSEVAVSRKERKVVTDLLLALRAYGTIEPQPIRPSTVVNVLIRLLEASNNCIKLLLAGRLLARIALRRTASTKFLLELSKISGELNVVSLTFLLCLFLTPICESLRPARCT